LHPIVLASSSQWRIKLLLDIGLNVRAIPSNIDEGNIFGGSPIQTAKLRAYAKARNVFEQIGESIVIGADQVCHFDGITIGKPESDKEWLDRLSSFRGRPHFLTTAVTIFSSEKVVEFYETTTVYFRKDLSKEVLKKYIEINEARGCAGGYMMENRGAWLIERIEGDWQNVIGLPIFGLTQHLRQFGIDYFGSTNE
jgi:septum formation protein